MTDLTPEALHKTWYVEGEHHPITGFDYADTYQLRERGVAPGDLFVFDYQIFRAVCDIPEFYPSRILEAAE